jgi:hypothetical protein
VTPPPPHPAPPTWVGKPTPIPEQEPLMKINFSTTTGADGTGYVPITVQSGQQLLGGWVDVLDDTASSPPAHDKDLPVPATGHSGVVCAPCVPPKPGTTVQDLRIAGAIPGHFYTGHAITG